MKNVYITCENERSLSRKSLLYCLTTCEDRCDAFFSLPESTILAVIKADQGRHRIRYDQLRLFPMVKSPRRR